MDNIIKQKLNDGHAIITHTSIDIDYMLKKYSRGDLDFLSEGDRLLSHEEATQHLLSLKAKGHKLLCCSGDECIGFDPFGGGCPGHVKGEYDEGFIYAVKHTDSLAPTNNKLYQEDWSLCFYSDGDFYLCCSPSHKLIRFETDEVIEAVKVSQDREWIKFRCYDVLMEERKAKEKGRLLQEALSNCEKKDDNLLY